MSNNQTITEIDDDSPINASDNDVLSDLSAYNSENDNEDNEDTTTTTTANEKKTNSVVFNEINDSLLSNLQLDSNNTNQASNIKLRTKNKNTIDRDKLDSIRYSMYTLQNSQVNDIDTLLEELCDIGNTFEIIPQKNLKSNQKHKINNIDDANNISKQFDDVLKLITDSIDEPLNITIQQSQNDSQYASSINSSPKSQENISSSSSTSSGIIDDSDHVKSLAGTKQINNHDQLFSIKQNFNNFPQQQQQQQQQQAKRNSSDSAFSDTLSLPSSQSISTLIMTTNKQYNNFASNNTNNQQQIQQNTQANNNSDNSQLSELEKAEFEKAEKIRIALEKIKEANIKKLIVKAYTDDGCIKSILIDENMKTYDVMLSLLNKTHTLPTIKYSVIERLPKMFMERIVEDHESLVEVMSHWTRDSENQIIFTQKDEKYDLFLKPEIYLTNEPSAKIEESKRANILNEFFQNAGAAIQGIEGPLYIKSESKKSWKKYYCVLRQSGLYFIPKGKQKKDIQCLFNFDKLDIYRGFDWKKEFKAPTDFCFGLKYPQIQKVSPKYMKYICCETERDLKRWMSGIRLVKFGTQLYDNFKKMTELEELSKISGYLLFSNRRSSASLSTSQRPKSNYSINSTTLERSNSLNSNIKPQITVVRSPSIFDNKVNAAISENEEITNTYNSDSNFNNENNNLRATNNYTITPKLLQQTQSFAPIKSSQEASSLLNRLKPARTNSTASTSSMSSTSNQKTAKLPVTTGITKQMLASTDSNAQALRSEENTNDIGTSIPIVLNSNQERIENFFSKTNKATNNFNQQYSPELRLQETNVFDFPSPPAELLEPQNEQNNYISNSPLPSPPVTVLTREAPTNQVKQITKGPPPPIAPKPALQLPDVNRQSYNSSSYRISTEPLSPTENYQRRLSNNNNSMPPKLPINSNNNNPILLDELNSKLARQRKRIETDENNNKNTNNNNNESPKVQRRAPPPPPPRSDSIRISNSNFIMNNNLN